MSSSNNSRIWKEIDRLYAWISIGIILVLALIYFIVYSFVPESFARSLALNVISDLIPVFIVFVGAYWFLRRIQQFRSQEEITRLSDSISVKVAQSLAQRLLHNSSEVVYYEEFYKVPWNDLLNTCSALDIIVHYYDTWINTNARSLQSVLDRGGTIRVILPNYENKELLSWIQKRFPEYSPDLLRKKISNTEEKLKLLVRNSTNKHARLEVYYVDHMIWYAALRFDRRYLILSPYEHSRQMRLSAPAILVSLSSFEIAQNWFEKEFQGLIELSVEQSVYTGTTA